MPTQYTRDCAHCGGQYTTKANRQRYCSRRCAGKAGPPPLPHGNGVVTLACSVCGKVFTRDHAAAARRKAAYCSKDCQHEGMRKAGVTPDGYIRVNVGGRRRLEHDVIWEAAHGPIPPGHDVHHKDRNRANNALDNLELLTKSAHMRLHGRLRHILRPANPPGAF